MKFQFSFCSWKHLSGRVVACSPSRVLEDVWQRSYCLECWKTWGQSSEKHTKNKSLKLVIAASLLFHQESTIYEVEWRLLRVRTVCREVSMPAYGQQSLRRPEVCVRVGEWHACLWATMRPKVGVGVTCLPVGYNASGRRLGVGCCRGMACLPVMHCFCELHVAHCKSDSDC